MNSYDYKDALDYAIVEILHLKHAPVRYHELVEEISKYCRISPSTLTRHLKTLAARSIIKRKLQKNGRATYELTKRFKEVSEILRNKYPTNYWHEAFIREPFDKDTFEFGIPMVRNTPVSEYWPQRKGKWPSWYLPPDFGNRRRNRRKTN